MMIKNENAGNRILYTHMCSILIWVEVVYSSIIQDKYVQIPGGMLIIGIGILVTFLLSMENNTLVITDVFSDESLPLIVFMIYMFVVGCIVTPDISGHITQWITCAEYLFILIVITYIIRQNDGTETFHLLLLFEAVVLAIIFLREPIVYDAGRYSISRRVNPNGLGMSFTSGIWSTLYYHQRKRLPLMISLGLCSVYGYCILLTGSRKAMIAGISIILLWFVFVYLPSLKERNWAFGMITLAFTIVLVLIIGKRFISFYSGSYIEKRMQMLKYEMSEGKRANMYRYGINLLKDSPFFGIGFRGFSHFYGTYSHTTIIEVLVSGGAVGSLLYFASYVVSIKKCLCVFLMSKDDERFVIECKISKMLIILWIVMLFYTTCIIHPYQFESYIIFGLIFGQSTVLYKKITTSPKMPTQNLRESKYIR